MPPVGEPATLTSCALLTRRGALATSVALAAGAARARRAQAASKTATRAVPLADLPMQRIRLPKGGVGRECVVRVLGGGGHVLRRVAGCAQQAGEEALP
jgi:hypothetical protein